MRTRACLCPHACTQGRRHLLLLLLLGGMACNSKGVCVPGRACERAATPTRAAFAASFFNFSFFAACWLSSPPCWLKATSPGCLRGRPLSGARGLARLWPRTLVLVLVPCMLVLVPCMLCSVPCFGA